MMRQLCLLIVVVSVAAASDAKPNDLDAIPTATCYQGFKYWSLLGEYLTGIDQQTQIRAEAKLTGGRGRWKAYCNTVGFSKEKWSADGQKWKSSTGAQEHCVAGLRRHFSERTRGSTMAQDLADVQEHCNQLAVDRFKKVQGLLQEAQHVWKAERANTHDAIMNKIDRMMGDIGLSSVQAGASFDGQTVSFNAKVNDNSGHSLKWHTQPHSGSSPTLGQSLASVPVAVSFSPEAGTASAVRQTAFVVQKPNDFKSIPCTEYNHVTFVIQAADGLYEFGFYGRGKGNDLHQVGSGHEVTIDKYKAISGHVAPASRAIVTGHTLNEYIAHAKAYPNKNYNLVSNNCGHFVDYMSKFAGMPYDKTAVLGGCLKTIWSQAKR
eukprot:m.293073 g.293073  ORF g.293073 m.293073 type:complete len:378 (-) comp18302_c0_seq1:73-1206(-)